ncbi:RHS repeat-associated core domain-containing protein [Chryseobacterium kwangjuense]|nr:RHS repeat-associated core domain-containing protein [Chryseobacterium kwangjuense]
MIHMNGRLYDPLLRRFLNADENIQDPTNTQNYNKYGYILNNPLMFNDPSGEVIFAFIAAWGVSALWGTIISGAIIGAAIGAGMYAERSIISGNWSWGAFAKSILLGTVSGAVGAGVSTLFQAGSIIGGAMAGMAGGFSQGVLNTVIGQANWNGIWQGAITGFLGGGAAMIGGGTVAANIAWGAGTGAIVGGVGSTLAGGNFWEGALPGAITGAAFAVATSGIEMIKNYKDGYGFKTNTGVVKSLVNQANVNGTIDSIAAQRAIDFVQNRYNLKDAKMTYDGTYDGFGVTNLTTGNIRIGDTAFISASMFKATISHEYYHSTLDRIYTLDKGYTWADPRGIFSRDGYLGYK